MAAHSLNAQTFEQLFYEKYEQLYFFAYDYIWDEEASRDIVSESFGLLWRHRERIDIAKANSYMHTVVHNKCMDFLRTEKRRNRFEEAYPQLHNEVDSTEWMEREERIAEVMAAVRRLPERTQWVLRQRYEGHRSYQEIADELGISINGMKKLISRTFQQLREALNAKKDKNRYTNRQFDVLLIAILSSSWTI